MTYEVLRERAGHVTLLLLLLLLVLQLLLDRLQLLGQQRLQRRLVDAVMVMVVMVMVFMVMAVVVMVAKRRVDRFRGTPAAAASANPVPLPSVGRRGWSTGQL